MFSQNPLVVEEAAKIGRALSHPVRLQILEQLGDEGAYVMHLTALLGRPQANISQHLMVLREAGLVSAARDGMTVIYRVRDRRVLDVLDRLRALAEAQAESRMVIAAAPPPESGPRLRKRRRNCRCPRCRHRHEHCV